MSESNKALVYRYLDEGMNKRNFAILNEVFSTDFINHSPRIDQVGREETIQDYIKFFAAFPDWQTIIEDIIAEGDKVVVRRSVHGTHKGDIPGIPMTPTGKQITFTLWEMFRITDGQIVERWGIHNLKEQLGAI
jgi:steroid delta-isomerase-like uncharacterized protein